MSDSTPSTILVVDDREENLFALERLLQELDCLIVKASSGQQALEVLIDTEVALILLDVQMPDMDGFETAEYIRSSKRTRYIPIIFVTAISKEQKFVFKGYDIGAVDYIFKPFEPHILLGKVKVFLELDEQKRLITKAKQELTSQNQRLEELNKLKNKFLGMAAHDLRNPLTVIQSVTSFILDEQFGPISAKQRTMLTTMDRSSRHMLNLVNELLDFSAIESGHLELSLQDSDVTALLRASFESNQILTKTKSIELALQLRADPPSVRLDQHRINQVIDNLISNALKFSYPESRITLGLDQDDDVVYITVADEGQGIPAEELSTLFQEYTRTSVRATGGEKSTGLGLAICHRIITAHGGDIEVQSQVGKGSTFIIKLPVRGPT